MHALQGADQSSSWPAVKLCSIKDPDAATCQNLRLLAAVVVCMEGVVVAAHASLEAYGGHSGLDFPG